MKNKFFKHVALVLLAVVMFACYDDFKTDFDYTATYFTMQSPLRTVLIGEGANASFEFGAMLGGRYTNERSETVNFEIDPSLLVDTAFELHLLPEAYYELSHASQITIPSGDVLGTVEVTLNEAFFADAASHQLHYALPLRITSTSLDSILPLKSTSIIAVKYENKYYGAYRVKGVDYTLDASDEVTNTFVYSESDLSQNIYTTLGTLAQDTSTLSYMGADLTKFNTLKLAIQDDGAVSISSYQVDSAVVVSGMGHYDANDKMFYLDYTYSNNGEHHQVYDTLYHFTNPTKVESWR